MNPAADAPRDWIAEAHLIARSAPGLGNPLDLTCAEFDAHLRLAANGHAPERSDSRAWARRYVEQNA
jgi:hypothetical protein